MHYRISLHSSCIKLKGNMTGGGIGGKGMRGRGSFSCREFQLLIVSFVKDARARLDLDLLQMVQVYMGIKVFYLKLSR